MNFDKVKANKEKLWDVIIKGQLISKGNFGVFNSFKDELEHFNFYPSLGQTFFVRFLEELKKAKSPFEINWPLGSVE